MRIKLPMNVKYIKQVVHKYINVRYCCYYYWSGTILGSGDIAVNKKTARVEGGVLK